MKRTVRVGSEIIADCHAQRGTDGITVVSARIRNPLSWPDEGKLWIDILPGKLDMDESNHLMSQLGKGKLIQVQLEFSAKRDAASQLVDDVEARITHVVVGNVQYVVGAPPSQGDELKLTIGG